MGRILQGFQKFRMDLRGAYFIALLCTIIAGVGGQAPEGLPTATPATPTASPPTTPAAPTPPVTRSAAPSPPTTPVTPVAAPVSSPPATSPPPSPVPAPSLYVHFSGPSVSFQRKVGPCMCTVTLTVQNLCVKLTCKILYLNFISDYSEFHKILYSEFHKILYSEFHKILYVTVTLAFILLFSCLSTALLYWASPGGPAWGRHRRLSHPKSLPPSIPGPRGLPLLGSIHLMLGLAHRKLAAEARRCGATRLMALSLGQTRVIITSHPDVAKDILNSSAFADRPVKESAYSLLLHRAIGFAPYGVYWRTLSRIAATHLFCRKQITASAPQRSHIASQLVSALRSHGNHVRIRDLLKRASLNNMMCSVFGRNYDLCSLNKETEELGSLVEDGYELLGKLNLSDHLPFLSGFDPQKIRSRCSQLVPRVNRFVNRIVDEHRSQTRHPTRDFVDVLLSLEGSDRLSDPDMVAVLWEMIFRGTDTVAVLIEWVLARLILHPDVQQKVHDELDSVVGVSRPVTESDVPALVYLQAVIKEVLRLHPPGPLLSWARLAITDTVVDGCHVPAGTTAMVNMWAITRDPEVWTQPVSFLPARFLEGPDVEFSVLGSDLRLAPFGSGRRSCPGKALGLATVSFWVASLLHEFEWAKPDRSQVSLGEVLRLSCEMSFPLTAKLRPRNR